MSIQYSLSFSLSLSLWLSPHIYTHDNHTYFGFIQLSRQINYALFTLIALIFVGLKYTVTTTASHRRRLFNTIEIRYRYQRESRIHRSIMSIQFNEILSAMDANELTNIFGQWFSGWYRVSSSWHRDKSKQEHNSSLDQVFRCVKLLPPVSY